MSVHTQAEINQRQNAACLRMPINHIALERKLLTTPTTIR